MMSLNLKLALTALAVAALATPAFAQRQHQRVLQDYAGSQTYQAGPAPHYPDFGADRTGSLESQESGAQFSLGR